MLHSMGRKTQGNDLESLLTDCHARIRSFLALALSVGASPDAPALENVEACARIERYFTLALPLHVRDEEESVLPRLYGSAPDVDAALACMRDEHTVHVEGIDDLVERCAAVRLRPEDASGYPALLDTARALQGELEPHLQAEERVIFPAIRAFISPGKQRVIIDELRARRTSPT
jgi:iron-sulfur cluster repair protein YtfE (RIC family)